MSLRALIHNLYIYLYNKYFNFLCLEIKTNDYFICFIQSLCRISAHSCHFGKPHVQKKSKQKGARTFKSNYSGISIRETHHCRRLFLCLRLIWKY